MQNGRFGAVTDTRMYLCSSCYRRCLWDDLSPKEHRCPNCRLPTKLCAICDTCFEPRSEKQLYCKRCDFYLAKHSAVMPPMQGLNFSTKRPGDRELSEFEEDMSSFG